MGQALGRESDLPVRAPNLDGILKCTSDKPARSQIQLFRNASIEARWCCLSPLTTEKIINDVLFKKVLNNGFKKYMSFYDKYSIQGPFIVFVNLLNIKDYSLHLQSDNDTSEVNELNRLNLSNIEVKPDNIDNALEPIFKIFYNAFGRVKLS